jgi:hypothetical protein
MGFDSAILAGRRLIDTTLVDTAVPHRRAVASDNAGGQVETFPADAGPVRCRWSSIVDPLPVEQVEGVFGVPTAQVFFSLADAVGLHEGDRLVNPADSSLWVVVGNKTAASDYAVVDRVLIREV